MATTGTKLQVPHIVNTSGATVGQGIAPELWVLYSTDDASVSAPTWNDATPKIRSFSTSRGRATELEDVDAGTGSVTLDNRTRTFDPTFNSGIRPMNRWLIKEQFSGETQDIFRGYAESYDQQWPSGMDAECVVSLVDEFKVLALDRLPVTDPPADSYEALVAFDAPSTHWRFSSYGEEWQASIGSVSELNQTIFIRNETPIVGDYTGSTESGSSGSLRLSSGLAIQGSAEMGQTNGNVFSVELWFRADDVTPSAQKTLFAGPYTADPNLGGRSNWRLLLNTGGTISFDAENSSGTVYTATSSSTLVDNTWHYIVATCDSGFVIRLYIDAVQVGTVTGAGTVRAGLEVGEQELSNLVTRLGDATTGPVTDWDEVAFYRGVALSSSRILAHYAAGLTQGFVAQVTGVRVNAILDAVDSEAPRRVDAGVRTVMARYMTGQDPLGEIRLADRADDPDSIFFSARDGSYVFLDGDHRSSSPYNTVQATFDDDGTDLPYLDADVDYSDSFLANELNVTRVMGTTQTASDATSIARYRKRPRSITDLPVTQNSDALALATAELAKYKDPMTRINSLTLTTADPAVTEAAFRRDIGDRIRVFRTPPGGGSRIDQTLFIQRIEISGANDGAPWVIRWGVSPL